MSRYMMKLEKEMAKSAGENVSIDNFGGVVYVFGSEIACLRIFYKRSRIYGLGKDARVEYSENLGSWFYCDEAVSVESPCN